MARCASLRVAAVAALVSLCWPAGPRSRVFVLYLDTYHLPDLFQGVNHYPARDALRTWLRSLVGEDDVIAFMTPEMDVEALTFTRRTSAIDEFLRERWMREIRIDDHDAIERMYQMCYSRYEEMWVEEAMIARKRERKVISTLRGLIARLGGLRDDRKAVILVRGGWTLFGRDARGPRRAGRLPHRAVNGAALCRRSPPITSPPHTGHASVADTAVGRPLRWRQVTWESPSRGA